MEESKSVVFAGCCNSERSIRSEINRIDWFALAHDFTNRSASVSCEDVTKPATPLIDQS